MRIFNLNISYKSSWALYSSDRLSPLGSTVGEAPYAFSGKRATQEKQDGAIQNIIKKWANSFFSANNVIPDSKITPLKNASKASRTFDVVAKIL